MDTKEEKAKEYSEWLHKEIEEYYGRKCDPKDMYYKNGDIRSAFEEGWDAALKNILVDTSKELPEYDKSVLVINKKGEKFFCHRNNDNMVQTDKDGWCNYSGYDIVAWVRHTTCDEILNLNKDVLERLKNK